jgi:mono/diheme cytochrome c family protein
MMKKVLMYVAWGLGTIVLVALLAYAWANHVATDLYEKPWDVHKAEFPIPFPLNDSDLAALRAERILAGAPAETPLADVDLNAIALERAIKRGKHLVDSRVGCHSCHARDFGGAPVIDIALVGHWVAPNLTAGEGSVTKGFTSNDWDRAVRHGVRHNGKTSSMPSQDYVNLTDHELSDIVAYIRSMPPVNKDMGPVKLGPVFAFIIATEPQTFAATTVDHFKAHVVEPPAETPDAEFGQHIAQVCRGCHGANLSGGKLAGDPDMPIVANITPHETGIKSWSEADFIRALREGKRKDGTAIDPMMPWQIYGKMSDTELKAVYAYLRTVPPLEKGNH